MDLVQLFSIPKRIFYFKNVIPTLEIYAQKRLGTVRTCFYIEEILGNTKVASEYGMQLIQALQ